MPSSADQYSAFNPQEPVQDGPGPVGYLALVMAWVVPGLGHFMIGQRARGVILFLAIHLLFAGGLFIGGIRAINPPDQAIWTYTQFLTGWPMIVANKVEHQARLIAGDPTALTEAGRKGQLGELFDAQTPANESLFDKQARTIAFIQDHPLFAYHPKVQDLGAVYCGIAGMLNLLVMFDVLLRITGSVREDPSKMKNKGSGIGQLILQSADATGPARPKSESPPK